MKPFQRAFTNLAVLASFALSVAQAAPTESTPSAPMPARTETEVRAALEPKVQDNPTPVSMARPNALGVELLGRNYLYSLNYDRSLTPWLALGGGISVYAVSFFSAWAGAVLLPVYANFYVLPDSHRPFFTAGTTFAIGMAGYDSESTSTAFMQNLNIGGGYEYRGESGFFLRASAYLIAMNFGKVLGWSLAPYIGVTLGGTF